MESLKWEDQMILDIRGQQGPVCLPAEGGKESTSPSGVEEKDREQGATGHRLFVTYLVILMSVYNQ